MINVLTDPVIRCDASDGSRVGASLPDVYAQLMSDAIDAFPALRPHQRHAWHAFLVQLGAMALHRAGASEAPGDADGWASIIRGLTPDDAGDECWQLVVDDITKPAFLQPPAGSADREPDYKHEVRTPDELDMLVTARNHDLKSAVAGKASTDDWVFALITLQTMEGYGGPSNYGISRMNGGYGNRPAFTLAPPGGPGAHVRRDILALLESAAEPAERVPDAGRWPSTNLDDPVGRSVRRSATAKSVRPVLYRNLPACPAALRRGPHPERRSGRVQGATNRSPGSERPNGRPVDPGEPEGLQVTDSFT